MRKCLPILGHVTELRSDLPSNKTISFQTVINGRPVNVGIWIKDLKGPGLVNVNVHRVIARFRSNPKLKIRVLVNGKKTMILNLSSLVKFVRVIFGYDVVDGIPTKIFAKGLKEKKEDLYLRIRLLKKKRSEKYAKRENDPDELVDLIRYGEALPEDDKAEVRKAVVAPCQVHVTIRAFRQEPAPKVHT